MVLLIAGATTYLVLRESGVVGPTGWTADALEICREYDEALDLESTSLSEDAENYERSANDLAALSSDDPDARELISDMNSYAELKNEVADSMDSDDLDDMLDSLDTIDESGEIRDRWTRWFRDQDMTACRNVFYLEKDDI